MSFTSFPPSFLWAKKSLNQILWKVYNRNIKVYHQFCSFQLWRVYFFFLQWNTEAVSRRCSVKKVFLKISINLEGNTRVRVSFSIKLQAWGLKKRDWQIFSSEFCKIFKNTFFTKPLRWLPLKIMPCLFGWQLWG